MGPGNGLLGVEEYTQAKSSAVSEIGDLRTGLHHETRGFDYIIIGCGRRMCFWRHTCRKIPVRVYVFWKQ